MNEVEKIEEMETFFNRVVADGDYEQHMMDFVDGADEYYDITAKLIANAQPKKLLDLGCGSGLQLDAIFKLLPDIPVVGVDLSQNMLDALRKKHPTKNLHLIHGSYFDVDFGAGFDAAVSVMTLHHFDHPTKLGLYQKIHAALTENGVYVETDYMVETQEREDFFVAERKRLRMENNIPDGVFDNYDTPCTVENQIKLLCQAGFTTVSEHWSHKHTHILIARK